MIDVSERNRIRVLRMNRPPVNALSTRLMDSLVHEIGRGAEEGSLGLILAGGDPVFSAGLDLHELLEMGRTELAAALERFFDTLLALAVSPVPTAAAIGGHCPAGGAVLSMFCDRRVMVREGATIGLNEVTIGIPVPRVVGDLARRTVGIRRAEELCVTGRLLGPEEAGDVGLVDELADRGREVEVAEEWLRRLAGFPRSALRRTREVVRGDLAELVRRNRDEDLRVLVEAWFGDELQSSLRAVVDRLRGR